MVHKPGETVPRSGIYRVIHYKSHVENDEATCLFGAKFPHCIYCGDRARFILVHAATLIDFHKQFAAR